MNYIRVTGYCPEKDYSFIIDSFGMFNEKWELTSLLVKNKMKILEISDEQTFKDVNIDKIEEDKEHFYLRACQSGKPEYIDQTINGQTYKAVKIADKIYIPQGEKV